MTTIPTLQSLYNSIISDIETEFGVVISFFGKSFLRIFAGVQAGKLYIFYLLLAQLQKNIWIDTADPASAGGTLERFGIAKLGRLPFAATQGQYEVSVTGSNGATIPALTTYKSDDTSANPNKLYILDTAFTFSGTSGTITLRALTAGTEANLVAGNTLTATAPIALVSQVATVTAETVAPANAEDIEEYRRKGIQAFRLEPQGGAPADYRLWGYNAQGVREIYPYAVSGQPNEIDVYVEANPDDSTDGDGTPTGTIMMAVESCIDLDPDTTKTMAERSRRPMQAWVSVQPIAVIDVDINIPGFADLTPDKEAIILAALEELLFNVRPFIASADAVAERRDVLNTNTIAYAVQAAIPGSIFSPVELTVNGNPVLSYQFDLGEIPNLNALTYV